MDNQQSKTTGKSPDYRISLVKQTATGNDQWAPLGVGWTNKDGQGISFECDLLKLLGYKLVARKIEPKS